MMKRIAAILLALMLALVGTAALADVTTFPKTTKTDIAVHSSYPDNPVIPGENPITGLPCSEPYTPILVVLDGSPEAQPHWGVGQADIIFQVPNAGSASTKLMALFTSSYPEQAGGVRSARSAMVPLATCFDAAFVHAGEPPLEGNTEAKPTNLMRKWDMGKRGLMYNLLGNLYRERITEYGGGSHNLSGHIKEIHEHLLAEKVEFDMRPFQFSDEPRTEGADAASIEMLHYSGEPRKLGSQATLRFAYDEAQGGYILTNSGGVYRDRLADDPIVFANVVVLRSDMNWRTDGYFTLKTHLTGSGSMALYQNGKYVRGAWYREANTSRLVLVGEDGEELTMQRGKTFIELTTDSTEITCK